MAGNVMSFVDAIDLVANLGLGPDEGVCIEMGRSGDNRQTWDRRNPESVEIARAWFNDCRARGMTIFAVNSKGEKGPQVTEFDSNAEAYIAQPRPVGG